MEEGYAFHWNPGECPVMTTPSGENITLTVEKNIPMMRTGSSLRFTGYRDDRVAAPGSDVDPSHEDVQVKTEPDEVPPPLIHDDAIEIG